MEDASKNTEIFYAPTAAAQFVEDKSPKTRSQTG
jgi:hypothetical protein